MYTADRLQSGEKRTYLQSVLQQITDDVITHLGCAAAFVTTMRPEEAPSIQAYAYDDSARLLSQTAVFGRTAVGTTGTLELGPRRRSLSRVTVPRAANGRTPLFSISDQLYDLLRPGIGRTEAEQIQREMGIRQVVAVPFLLGEEVLGNVLAAKKRPFSEREIDFLQAFGRQAALAVQGQRQLAGMAVLEEVIFSLQARVMDETQVLQTIVDAVVAELGYAGAMVATLEPGRRLPVRAYKIDVAEELLDKLQARAGLEIVGPRAEVRLDDSRYTDNLSVRAVQGNHGRPHRYLTSDHLHDLLRPLVPRPLAEIMQRILGIKQVVAVPFLLDDEVVGNLFVATRKSAFSDWEMSLLLSLGQQAAVGIRNARLYSEANEHRQVAEMFGRMAFSATASVHALRNHLSAVSTYLDVMSMVGQDAARLAEMSVRSRSMGDRLRKAANILDYLHEPWRQPAETAVSVVDCLYRAVKEVFPELLLDDASRTVTVATGIKLHFDLMTDLPSVATSADMLTEAFRVLIKNGTEALLERGDEMRLWLAAYQSHPDRVTVTIRDSGVGIRPEHRDQIFSLGWSTKNGQGMGFGLFWTKDYITGLGGQIVVDSVPGQGSTFSVTLPAG